MNADKLNAKVNKVVESMTVEQQEAVKKEYPFKEKRDSVIRELAFQGVESCVLTKISGMGSSSISRIIVGEQRIPKTKEVSSGLSFEKSIERLCQVLRNFVSDLQKQLKN